MRHSVIVSVSLAFTLILAAAGASAANTSSAPPIHRYRVIPPPQPMQAAPMQEASAEHSPTPGPTDAAATPQQPAFTSGAASPEIPDPATAAMPMQPDSARALQEFLKNPVVQLLIKAGGDQKFIASLQAVVAHPDRKLLVSLEIGFFILFLFLRPRILNYAASGWSQIFGRIALNLGFTGVTAFLLPALVLGSAYTELLANLIRVLS